MSSVEREGMRGVLFAGGCLLGPAPDREASVREVFVRARKKGGIRKAIHTLIKRVSILPKEKQEAEAFIAAKVIREACPSISIKALVERVVNDATYLILKRPELKMAAAILIAAILVLFPC